MVGSVAGIDGERWKMVKLITDNILDLTTQFWDEVGDKIHDWVGDDADKGTMQDNTSNHHYTSPQYVKYKKNDMRRLTIDKGKKKGKKVTTQYKGREYGAGKRLKGYETGGLSNQTSFVNMRLTSKTLNSLKPKSSTKVSVTMHFDQTPAGILTGNRDRGYDIIGLNTINREKVRQRLIKAFGDNLRKAGNPPIIIEVS